MELYVKLTELRKKSAISQSDAATRIGVSRQTISKWESGTVMPDMKNLALIAEVYNVTVEDLLNEDFDISDYENTIVDTEIVVGEPIFEEKIDEEAESANEIEADEAIFDDSDEKCECCCDDCDECEAEEKEKAAEKIYNKVKSKLGEAKTIATEKLSSVEISKKTLVASLAAICGTSAILATAIKSGPAKKTAALIAGASFAAGAGIVIKDIYDRRKASVCEETCDEAIDSSVCDCECCCDAEIAEDSCCDCEEIAENEA